VALLKTINSGMPFKQRGQGVAEAMITLPAFLILLCIICQLFLLGIAKARLQYAAFYAARVGAVNSKSKKLMKQAVDRILNSGLVSTSALNASIKVEIIDPDSKDGNESDSLSPTDLKSLRVRIHWHYPLTIPLADVLIPGTNVSPLTGKRSIHLQASWMLTIFGPISRNNNAEHRQDYK
jgi:hypothetical protein